MLELHALLGLGVFYSQHIAGCALARELENIHRVVAGKRFGMGINCVAALVEPGDFHGHALVVAIGPCCNRHCSDCVASCEVDFRTGDAAALL